MQDKIFDVKAEWKSQIPEPIIDAHPEYVALYWKAWESAHEHLINVPGMPQTPHMDEGFCETDIWVWDTCFMSLYCKYAQNRFPGVESLNNFYQPFYDGIQLPTIIPKNPQPAWTGAIKGQEAQFFVHIFDNPPLFSWAEWQNALFSGDREYLRKLLLEQKYLQKHFSRLNQLSKAQKINSVRLPTCLVRHPLGYFWEGGRSGMDNTPRGRTGEHAVVNRPNNPDMLWLDAISQQGLAANCIARLAELIDEPVLAKEWRQHYHQLRDLVNRYYWDDNDGCYYDIHATTQEKMKVMTIASFWPLAANMASMEQAAAMLRHLRDPQKFGGDIPLVSLARDDADFNKQTGDYWRGSLWLPTAYMTLKGCENYGYFDDASAIAAKILAHLSRTYQEYAPHTIWECYNPNLAMPACSCDEGKRIVRPDFCGWSALGPINLLLENLIGIYEVDAFHRTVKWRPGIKTDGALGVKHLRFGDVVADMVYRQEELFIHSNQAFILQFRDLTLAVNAGENNFKV
jgi:hypothetical protein